jgi:hypothetical protein
MIKFHCILDARGPPLLDEIPCSPIDCSRSQWFGTCGEDNYQAKVIVVPGHAPTHVSGLLEWSVRAAVCELGSDST